MKIDLLNRPLCSVSGCESWRQIYSITGSEASYLKTCRRHNYKDIENARATFKTHVPSVATAKQ